MKVTVGKRFSLPREFTVLIQQGSQQFHLGYQGSKAEAEWMADMFRKALRNHDKERDGKRSNSRNSAQEGIRDKAKRRK